MPDQNDLVMPPAGWESNDGIEEALADAYINLRILGQLDQILAGLFDEDSEHFRPYITDGTAVDLETGQLETRISSPVGFTPSAARAMSGSRSTPMPRHCKGWFLSPTVRCSFRMRQRLKMW